VTALEDTSAISVDRDSLLKLMRRDSLLAVKLLWSFVQVLSERLRNTNDALADLKSELDDVRARANDPVLDSVGPKKSGGPPPFGQ
jgi:CRP-like cAMP-binding protein